MMLIKEAKKAPDTIIIQKFQQDLKELKSAMAAGRITKLKYERCRAVLVLFSEALRAKQAEKHKGAGPCN